MENANASLIDSIQTIQKMYNMTYADAMSYWREYWEKAVAYHPVCPEEFHILMVRYVNDSILTTFEDFVEVTLKKEGRLKVEETML